MNTRSDSLVITICDESIVCQLNLKVAESIHHNSNPETDEAIDMRKYSAPSQVHIYFGHVECQDDMQNSYAAETYLTNPSGLLNLSAHLFTKNWFKHSDYPGFAKKWSKRF